MQLLTAFLHLLNWQTCVSCVVPGFLASKVPENLDAVVIGSGIGGLGVAVLLAKVGKKVLVLEQHDRAGGCCHTFSEKGYEFDVGPADSPLSFLACPGSHDRLQRLLSLWLDPQGSTTSGICWITSPSAACWTR